MAEFDLVIRNAMRYASHKDPEVAATSKSILAYCERLKRLESGDDVEKKW